jgi:3-hydroxybutyryl-CoA dehydrogenase
MKKVMVIGRPDRLEEFKLLNLKGCEVSYFDQMNIDIAQMAQEMQQEIPDLATSSVGVGEEFVGFGQDEFQEEDGLEADESEELDEDWDEDGTDGGETDNLLEEDDAPYGQQPVLNLDGYDILFDLTLDQCPENLFYYAWKPGLIVFGCSVLNSLSALESDYLGAMECTLFGINSLTGFINRPRMEVCVLRKEEEQLMKATLASLGLEADIVEDRVGMVSPRIVCMIINEACFTIQEGTAGAKEIDTAMKLGTAYPFGPLEWADKIGIENVYLVMNSLWEDSHDPRYRMAPLLKEHFLRSKTFYE